MNRQTASTEPCLPKPPWLRVRLGGGPRYQRLQHLLRGGELHTVCEEALCPNKGLCWQHGRATLLILGRRCTRRCRFCNVTSHPPAPPEQDEPARVAQAIKAMGLREAVLTSVTRDDLPDGGAALWAQTIRRTRAAVPGIVIEVLVPDFGGAPAALDAVLETRPDVFGHNLETVPSLYTAVRPQADYGRSLRVLRRAADAGLVVKTGIMVGLGETTEEVLAVMHDARQAGCAIFTVGQYLRPSREHAPVRRYVDPPEFDAYRERGLAIGFGVVVSAPLVRSSYHSEEQSRFVKTRQGEG